MTGFEEKLCWWSYGRQGLARRHDDMARALRSVIAVYSAHPSAPLSLRARCRNFSEEGFRRLDAKGETLRVPAMRSSIHMVPHDTAARLFWATVQPLSAYARRLRYAGVGEDEYPTLRDRILKVAREPMRPEDIGRHVDLGADKRLNTVLRYMALEGVLLRVGPDGLRSNQLSYVATDAWAPGALDQVSVAGAQAWLAEAYLRAFGPARRKDFQWWAGIKASAAKAAFAQIETADVGDGYLLPADEADGFSESEPTWDDTVDLLGKWDCYVMGYPADGRMRFVAPEHHDRIYNSAGDGLPVVMVNGRAVGAWGLRFDQDTMEVDLDLFDPPAKPVRAAIDEAFEGLSHDLGARRISLK